MRALTLTELKRSPWPAVLALGAVALVAAPWLVARARSRPAAPVTPATAAAPAVAPALPKTGKVGELTVTPEALEIAAIRTAPAGTRRVSETLPVSGVIEPEGDRMVKVTPRVGGKIVSVLAAKGDAVRAGQTLAVLESTELAKAQAEWEHSRIRLAVARKNLDRQKKLAELGAFANPAVEQARREAADARGEVGRLQAALGAAKTQVAEAQSALASWEGEVTSAQADVASAQSVVQEAQSDLGALDAAVAQAEAQERLASAAIARAQRLLEGEVVARSQVERAQAEHERARAEVRAAQAKLRQGQTKVETTRARVKAAEAKERAAVARVAQARTAIETAAARQKEAEAALTAAQQHAEITAQTLAREEAVTTGGYRTSKELVEAEATTEAAVHELEHCTRAVTILGAKPGGGTTINLSSPIDGRVQDRTVTVGETVDPGGHETPLFVIVNLDLVWAQLSVTPADLHRVRVGQRVALTAETSPGQKFAGTISSLGSAADATTRTIAVRCALVNRGTALRPDTFVRGEILTDLGRDRLVVPEGALQEHNGRPTLYVAAPRPGTFEVRHVQLGEKRDGQQEVVAGLSPGERVAVSGTFTLKAEALKSTTSDACCGAQQRQ